MAGDRPGVLKHGGPQVIIQRSFPRKWMVLGPQFWETQNFNCCLFLKMTLEALEVMSLFKSPVLHGRKLLCTFKFRMELLKKTTLLCEFSIFQFFRRLFFNFRPLSSENLQPSTHIFYCIRAMQGPKNSCRHPLHIIIISIKYTYILYIYIQISIYII